MVKSSGNFRPRTSGAPRLGTTGLVRHSVHNTANYMQQHLVVYAMELLDYNRVHAGVGCDENLTCVNPDPLEYMVYTFNSKII